MLRSRFKVEQIVQHLCEAEVLISQGQTIDQVCEKMM